MFIVAWCVGRELFGSSRIAQKFPFAALLCAGRGHEGPGSSCLGRYHVKNKWLVNFKVVRLCLKPVSIVFNTCLQKTTSTQ